MSAISVLILLTIVAVVSVLWRPSPRQFHVSEPAASAERFGRILRRAMTTLATVGAFVVAPPVAFGGLFWRFAAQPLVKARRTKAAAALEFELSLPYVVDVLRVAAHAGYNVSGCVAIAGRYAPGKLANRLRTAALHHAMGRSIVDVLDDVVAEFGDLVRPLVSVLVSSECDGVSIVTALERLADEVRRDTQRQAEVRARRVPVRLLVPLALGTLPAFVLLILVPVVAQAVTSLRLG